MKPTLRNPFRLRNFVLIALVLGIVAGIWLGDFFKGFGLGPGKGPGMGPGSGGTGSPGHSTTKLIGTSADDKADLVGHHTTDDSADGDTPKPAGLIKVVIDDRTYYVRRGKKLEPIKLPALVELIQQAPPNADGLKAVIERTGASRPSAEDKLFAALKSAGVDQDALYMPADPMN